MLKHKLYQLNRFSLFYLSYTSMKLLRKYILSRHYSTFWLVTTVFLISFQLYCASTIVFLTFWCSIIMSCLTPLMQKLLPKTIKNLPHSIHYLVSQSLKFWLLIYTYCSSHYVIMWLAAHQILSPSFWAHNWTAFPLLDVATWLNSSKWHANRSDRHDFQTLRLNISCTWPLLSFPIVWLNEDPSKTLEGKVTI